MYIIYNNVFSNIWDSIFVVIVNLDSLRSLHLASISARILISSTFFFSTPRFQIENRNTAVIHTIGKWCSSSMSNSRVIRFVDERVGRNFLRPWKSTWLDRRKRHVPGSLVYWFDIWSRLVTDYLSVIREDSSNPCSCWEDMVEKFEEEAAYVRI